MAHSLRDQLLKAGLVTTEQLEKANQPKPAPSRQAPSRDKAPRRDNRPAPTVEKPQRTENKAPRQTPKEKSDLEQFYAARAKTEREEREQAEQRQREIAARRKQTREQVAALISANLQNVDDADIRYNFVVGDNIKYLYVTEAQQQALAAGELAIIFLGGKRCLIPLDIAQQILALDPDKLIVINSPEESSEAPESAA